MVELASQQGLRAACLSLDAVYLSACERAQLAQRVHPLLRSRGPPGSHDLPLALATLAGLQQGRAMPLPGFDQLADERRPPATWQMAPSGLQLLVLVLVGWMLGVGAQPRQALQPPVNTLERQADADGRWRHWCNQRLAEDYPALWQHIHWLCLLQPPHWEVVLRWRIQQEQQLASQQQRTSMSARLVARFLPHLERVGRHAFAPLPASAALCVQLDAQRRVIGCSVASHWTRKVTRMLTRHSVISPLASVCTLISLTQAPCTPLTVLATFFSPLRTASSTLVADEALTSITFATDIGCTP